MDKAYVKDATADKGKGEEQILKAENLQLSEDDNVLVQGVEGNKNAIGYFGYAYFQENADKLKALKINGVAPVRFHRRRQHLPAGPPALHLQRPQDPGREAPGRRLHQLLPDLRQRRNRQGRLLPRQQCSR